MSGPTVLPQTLVAARKAGPALASFAAYTRLMSDEDAFSISPPFLAVGANIEFDGLVAIGNVVTTQPTFQLQVKVGSIVVWQSDAIQCKSSASSALPCEFDLKLRLDSIGKTNAAKLIGNGKYQCASFTTPQGLWQAATPAVGTGFGTTIDDGSVNMELGCLFSASSASNTAQLYRLKCQVTYY